MKKTIILVSIFGAIANFATAATITVTNYVDPIYNSINNSSNNPTSGILVLGTYTSDPVSPSAFMTGLTSLGSLQFGLTYGGPLDGYIAGNISFALNSGNPAIGQTVYAIVGNGASLATSTEVFVWKATSNPSGNVYTEDAPVGGPNDVVLFGSNGQMVIGSFNSGTNSFVMAPIPEPSAALLGALGALGLLRRRRI